jgi:type III restriction enzyme
MRTGNPDVDKLTVIAHDNFQQLIDAAHDPNSLLSKMSFVELDEPTTTIPEMEVFAAQDTQTALFVKEREAATNIKETKERDRAIIAVDAKNAVMQSLATVNSKIDCLDDLNKPEIKALVINQLEQCLEASLFKDGIIVEAIAQYANVIKQFKENVIPIPRLVIQTNDAKNWFDDFDLDTSDFDFTTMTERIKRVGLVTAETDYIGVQYGALSRDTPVKQLVSALIDYPEVDYNKDSQLIQKLAQQAITFLHANLKPDEQIETLVKQKFRYIAEQIYLQLLAHHHVETVSYNENVKVLPFTKIETWNFTALKLNGKRNFREFVKPINTIKRYLFNGFQKAGHLEYKFDSTPEQRFTHILEDDAMVLHWLRPAPKQFFIYYDERHLYRPDFVVETAKTIYIVEVKAANEMTDKDVIAKQTAAEVFCKIVSKYNATHEGKKWCYLLIAADNIATQHSFDNFL